jgi:predicted  nucleic acid-binding Zn-ribbon protein
MTEPFDTLLRVQGHDTTIDQLRQRQRTLPERAELEAVHRRLTEASVAGTALKAQVDELASRQGEIEAQIATTAGRRHEIEERMLNGTVTASRELQAMDAEVRHLVERQDQLEELELALVEEEDPLDAALAANEALVSDLVVESERLQAAVVDAVAVIERSVEEEVGLRGAAATGLPADLSDRYEKLRSHLGGVGAARLVGDQCDGCHLTLPSKEVERIRRLPPEEFAMCDQCGRILVH